MKKKIIARVCGGDSLEHDVSMRSAEGIYSFINKDVYECYIVELKGLKWEALLPDGSRVPVDRNDFSFSNGNTKIIPDFAYITIHGTPGENGLLQGYFDMIRMPYSTSGVLVEALTFNKFALNNYLRPWGVTIAESVLIRRRQKDAVNVEEIIAKVGAETLESLSKKEQMINCIVNGRIQKFLKENTLMNQEYQLSDDKATVAAALKAADADAKVLSFKRFSLSD